MFGLCPLEYLDCSDFICAVGGSRTTIVSRRMDERTQLGNVVVAR